jgi:hypothetical protein
MADIRVIVETAELKSGLKNKGQEIEKMLYEVMNQVMEKVFAESQVLVPVNTGALQDSGRIVRTGKMFGGLPEIAVVYGGGIVNYAVAVHEDTEAYHEHPTRAKYLEIPLLENQEVLADLIAQRLRVILSS